MRVLHPLAGPPPPEFLSARASCERSDDPPRPLRPHSVPVTIYQPMGFASGPRVGDLNDPLNPRISSAYVTEIPSIVSAVPNIPSVTNDDVAWCCGIPLNVDWTFLMVEIGVRGLLVIFGVLLILFYPPFVRRVWPTEWDHYAFPYAEEETFPMVQTVGLAIALTLTMLTVFLGLLWRVGGWKRQFVAEEAIFFMLGISLSALFAFTVSELTKRMYGRLRPDFLARCFGQGKLQDWLDRWGWRGLDDVPEVPDCSHSPLPWSVLEDGRMSFPSEHSCLTAAVFVFNALWSYGKLCLFQNVGALRLVIPFALISFPVAVAISRTSDYRHHATDVLAGFIFGSGAAVLSYCFYFPLPMRPLTTTVYALYEENLPDGMIRVREVEAARLRVLKSPLGGWQYKERVLPHVWRRRRTADLDVQP